MKRPTLKPKTKAAATEAGLRRVAEVRLQKRKRSGKAGAGDPVSAADTVRLLHELQVHQIELEVQNAELRATREEVEKTLEKYSDLYEFAPVGYFTVDEHGVILEANLRADAILGVGRAQLVDRRLQSFVATPSRAVWSNFLESVNASLEKKNCELLMLKANGVTFWADIQATPVFDCRNSGKTCRVVLSDITTVKRCEEAQRRAHALASVNEELRQEIVRRRATETALKNSEHEQGLLLVQSRTLQEELRLLSRRVLSVQEEERKRISRELHDVIAQMLTSINIRLATLKHDAAANAKGLSKKISRTQQVVEQLVDIVHRFARELRPTALDDLGLTPALHSYLKRFTKETGVRASLTSFAGLDRLSSAKRTALYRVAQEALTNIARHAHASRVDVTLQKVSNSVHMKIEDDGESFDIERMWHAGRNQHLGLLGMRERVEMVGGVFTVESAPGSGTTIHACIPFNQGSKERSHP